MKKYLKIFDSLIKNRKLPQSLILLSYSKYRKRNLSKYIAQYLITGEKPDMDNVDEFDHADLKFIYNDKGNIIKKDQIKNGMEFISKTPYSQNNNVLILEDSEYMNETSANMLLKRLEEPPEYSYIILLVSNREDLLPTILSRCQIFRIYEESREEIKKYFNNTNLQASDINYFYNLINYDYHNIDFSNYIKIKKEFFDFIGERNSISDIIQFVDKFLNARDSTFYFNMIVSFLYTFLRDVCFIQNNDKNKCIIWKEFFKENKNLDLYSNIFIIVEKIENYYKNKQIAINKRYFLLNLFLNLYDKE
ncbi:MAG: hypothetical protein FXF47_03280 [Candidatus Mcinerneyibacterium aminivorans]|uniref:DNA polymerase III subunit delta n=1 Tax=Candidatus Mcinerneyibacterium aminivorans TaxID=2703815 RepID=A0A5D0MJ44_9BACT|nr:MAG: hypothetical protein FXF47_03280 [Candidatus Mcinerneyibacterium aminivorans]